MPTSWTLSPKVFSAESSPIREILKVTEKPDIISFAGGLPAPELFPVQELERACQAALVQNGHKALQYSLSAGTHELRTFLAERYQRRGIDLTEENILITSGSQQGLDLMGRAFLDQRAVVLTENPTFLGAIQAFRGYQPLIETVEMDEERLLLNQTEDKLARFRPRLIYTIPDFQNPTGKTLSQPRRKELVKLAEEFNLPIVEDSAYEDLRYFGQELPSLKKIGGDSVIQLGSFSKIIAPGFRVGWVAASTKIMPILEKLKQPLDLHTSSFAQHVIWQFCQDGRLDSHIKTLKASYSSRRDAMLKALEERMPEYACWTKPEGGLFIWVQLPKGTDASRLLQEALKEKVAFVPGAKFFPNGGGENTFRLSYSTASPDKISEGVEKLAGVIRRNASVRPNVKPEELLKD
ncbi:MAG: PLP-dependent aminotransferase family protein [candidate division Zixibacteria bacterium]|nr:PLP-dependent aminotransferase family protein [candidate division Zixibacteria bacterium]